MALEEASLVAQLVKNPPAKAGDTRDTGSIPGSRKSPGRGYGNPLQYPDLENPMDRGVWWATVHRVTNSQTRLREHAHTHPGAGGSDCPPCSLGWAGNPEIASFLVWEMPTHSLCRRDLSVK